MIFIILFILGRLTIIHIFILSIKLGTHITRSRENLYQGPLYCP